VYPLPGYGGLGVHSTVDMAGILKFGPHSEWFPQQFNAANVRDISSGNLESLEELRKHYLPPKGHQAYLVNESLIPPFVNEIARYLPNITIDSLVPDYSGIRPKLIGPDHFTAGHSAPASRSTVDQYGRDLSDFVIEGPDNHGLDGLINLFGMESPGLTASLAIADEVSKSVIV
jgi:L-2-hydroxyglutarate oxidase LhgO